MASVAAQQKSSADNLVVASAGVFVSVDYFGHTDEELHNATVSALAAYTQKREEADAYAYDVLIPALNQIIQRYKQQGRATPYRLNGCPTVEEYFESIGLNYSTVRSWKSRAQQRLLQAVTDAGTKPATIPDADPIPHFNKAATKALIEGNHRAVEIVAALEAGRDGKKEIAEFKAVMDAERLDDIMQAHEHGPDYKGILSKVVQIVANMERSLPAAFVKSVRELTKDCRLKISVAPVKSQRSNGKVSAQPVPPAQPDQPPTTKIGDKSEPTPHGFFYEFIKDEKPYAVRDITNPHLGIMYKFKSKTEADRYITDREREAGTATKAARNGVVAAQVSENDYTEEEVAAMFA